jgi:hypothetical protein
MNKKAPKRGSAEERWYYLTEEGRNSIDLGDEFDCRRALELLFEDAPEVNWEHCSMEDFQTLRDAGVITKEECDNACDIIAFMIGHRFCSAQVKMPLSEKILVAFFGGPWAVWTWMIVLIIISAIVQCMNN